MLIRSIKIAVVLMSVLAASACETPENMSARATNYNVAVADTSNELFLLNALRASERLPTYYTRLEGDSSVFNDQIQAQQSGSIGRDVAKTGVQYLSSLTGGTENQLTLGTLDDQRFMRGILSPVPLDQLGFFMGEGWPPELLFSMTMARISTTRGEVNRLIDAFEADCREDPAGEYCNGQIPQDLGPGLPASGQQRQFVSQQLEACMNGDGVTRDLSANEADAVVFLNYPPNIDQMGCFQWALRVFIALGPELKSADTLQPVVENVPVGQNPGEAISNLLKSDYEVALDPARDAYTICKKTKVSGIALVRLRKIPEAANPTPAGGEGAIKAFSAAGPNIRKACASAGPASAAPEADKARAVQGDGTSEALKLEFTTRSLDGMVYYLGEVLRSASVTGPGPGRPIKVWVWRNGSRPGQTSGFEAWSLFEARPGDGLISVRFLKRIYGIPRACAAADDCESPTGRHTSFQVIALLNQIWGMQKEETQLPVTPVLTVLNP